MLACCALTLKACVLCCAATLGCCLQTKQQTQLDNKIDDLVDG